MKQRCPVEGNIAGHHSITWLLEFQTEDTGRIASHLANLILLEPDGLAETRRQQDVEHTIGGDHLNQFIIVVELDGNKAGS